VAIANFKTRSSLYPVWTNVRIGNDPSKPVLDFDPLSDIIVVMSNSLVSATAQVNSGAVPATITIMGRGQDTVVIHPQSSLPTGGTDSVSLFAQASDGTQYSGIIVTGLQPVTSVFVVASNVLYPGHGEPPERFDQYGPLVQDVGRAGCVDHQGDCNGHHDNGSDRQRRNGE